MKVRTKFTLWIALSSLFAASLFSFFLVYEVKEEVSEVVDFELNELASSVFKAVEESINSSRQFDASKSRFPMERYWIRVNRSGVGEPVYESKLAQLAEIPARDIGKSYMLTRNIAYEHIWIPPEEKEDIDELVGDEVKLRAHFYKKEIGGEQVEVLVARPMLLIGTEFSEVVFELTTGIVITVLVILVIAYLITGKMLSPLSHINREIKAIRETSLDKRILLGKSKDELYELSVELNSMFDRLQFSFEKQREFIGNASHEMKSPLTVLILGHEEMLMGSPPEQFRGELEKQLETMQRLNKLIRDLLSIARLEQQDILERESLSLKALIESILKNYEDLINNKGIELYTKIEPVTLQADYEKLHRLFINLIDNSIKYNLEDRGFLRVITIDQKESVMVKITNSGITIPEHDLKNIFNQFYRVEKSRSQEFGGSGLGLTIAKRIVEVHGGTIEAINEEDGVTFTVVLPYVKQDLR